jgi:uncharacterized delta-60 repeat protein
MYTMKMIFSSFLIGLFCLVYSAASFAQSCPGCLDTSFNGSGTQLIVTAGSGSTIQRDGIVQSDGKLVSLIDNSTTQATLVRLNTDGSLDTAFGNGGIVTTNWHFANALPYGFAFGLTTQIVSGEERIVVVGSWVVPGKRKNTTETDLRVDRYLSSGARDTSFGTNGSVILNKPYGLAVAVQPLDNKIITVGDLKGVVRLNPNGTLDTSFGQNHDGVAGAGQSGWSIKATIDGKIIIGGDSADKTSDLMCVSRLNTNGSVDTSFGSGGRSTANFFGSGSFGRAFRVDLDPFGNIILGGIARTKGASAVDNSYAAARFTANGQLDTTFNGTGMVSYHFPGVNGNGRSVVAQPDGNILLTGSEGPSGSGDYGMIRYNYNGSLDQTFGTNGIVATNIDGDDFSYTVRLWSDPACSCDKIVMFGGSKTGASFARYLTR